jgi:DNA repair photolyase
MKFLKKSVYDMRLGRNSISYISNKKTKTDMIDVVEPYFPFLKKYEIADIVDKIENSDDKDSIYESLGLNKYKKDKIKKKTESVKKEKKKQTVQEFLNENFRLEN